MTIIAYKDGLMAADSHAYVGGVLSGQVTKIKRNTKGDLIGISGDFALATEMLDWFMHGEKGFRPRMTDAHDKERNCSAVIVRARGKKIQPIEGSVPFEVGADYFAIGCGSYVAKGAMFAGADAITAVKTAIHLDAHCGGDILVIPHKGNIRRLVYKPVWVEQTA